MKLFMKAIDDNNIEKVNNLIHDFKYYNRKDIMVKFYKKELLTPKRLKFIIKNFNDCLYIPSFLIRKLIKDYETSGIIFENFKIYDDDFVKWLLFQYKNKKWISPTDLNKLISNKKYNMAKSLHLLYGNRIRKKSLRDCLNCACAIGREHIVKFLIKHGASINKINNKGQTSLFFACENGNIKLVKYLIEQGAAITKRDNSGKTLLFNA